MARRRSAEHEAEERSAQRFSSVASATSGQWVETQARIFGHFDEVARRWLDRRREALDATRRSFEEMRNTGNAGDLTRIQQEWLIGSMQRLAADFGELGTVAVNLAQTTASQIGRTSDATVDNMEKVGQEMMSAAGSKPRMRAAE